LGQVVVLDSAAKTNRSMMPLVAFVGLDENRKVGLEENKSILAIAC
jgi:hypothetical protein